MLSKYPPAPLAAAAVGFLAGVALVSGLRHADYAHAQKVERPRPAEQPRDAKDTDPGPIPKDDQLYVWPQPEQGTQSLVILRVVDGDTVEAAFMVPVMIRLWGCNAPESNTDEGKKAKEAMEKLVGGRLLPANLHGREKYGRTLADFWMGEKEGGWLSEVVIKAGNAKPWDGHGKRPLKEGDK